MCIDARTLDLTHTVGALQVMYFSSIFPYVVLIIFLVRGLMLDGAMEGIAYMFYPKVNTQFHHKRYIYIYICVYIDGSIFFNGYLYYFKITNHP